MKKFVLKYSLVPIATVEIDEASPALACIREMVEFWSGSEERLAEADGDYTVAWLRQLGVFILRNGRRPNGDEGWYPTTGTYGITVSEVEPWEFVEDEIEIVEKEAA